MKNNSSENSQEAFDLVFSQGQVALTHRGAGPADVQFVETDVAIRNGKIVSTRLLSQIEKSQAKEVVNAKGLHILPGVIDTQVHFREPGPTHKEDLQTGTLGAIFGGVTSVFEMPNTNPATTTLENLLTKQALVKDRAHCHVGFYVGASSENIDELASLERVKGCSGVKIFMGSSTGSLLVEDDETLLKILKSGSRRVAVHCEDEYRLRERKHIAIQGKNARFHPVWRDEETALLATKRLVKLATQARRPVHVLHVNTSEEIEFLSAFKNTASVEVLPQHLLLSAPECYERFGNYVQMNPPIRSKAHQEALWVALEKGIIDVLGSDHAPHTHEEKKLEYPASPSGMPGVQTLLPLMLNQVHLGRLSLAHLVKLVCHNPTRLFGIRNKGHIEVGADADLTLVDLKAELKIENSWIKSRCGWTPYDGYQVTGWPKATIIMGRFAMRDNGLVETQALGNLLDFDVL